MIPNVYLVTVVKSFEISIPVVAHSFDAAIDCAEYYAQNDLVEFDNPFDITATSCEELAAGGAVNKHGKPSIDLYENEYVLDATDGSWEVGDYKLREAIEDMRRMLEKKRSIPGTDEYQKHWESIGQQKLFNGEKNEAGSDSQG